jgi:hypothetical protein
VISQLVERYRMKRVRVCDLWHLTWRLMRKVLSYTYAIVQGKRAGLLPLRFSDLLID